MVSSGDHLASGRYQILRFVAKGGMGAVYLAEDGELRRKVALKALTTEFSDSIRNHALTEARALAAIAHPNIIRVFDVLVEDQTVFLITEWVEGKSASAFTESMHPLLVMAMLSQIFSGLAGIHEQEMVHRDLKPSNIMLARDGRILLIDFGLALSRDLSRGSTLAGTLRYLDPKVLEGKPADAKSDLFAVGLMALEFCLGQAVVPELAPIPLYKFYKEEFSIVVKRRCENLYPPVAHIIQKCLIHSQSEDMNAKFFARYLRTELAQLTELSPEELVKKLLIDSENNTDFLNARIKERVEAAVSEATMGAREKALWLGYAERYGAGDQSVSKRGFVKRYRTVASICVLAAFAIAGAWMVQIPQPKNKIRMVTSKVEETVMREVLPEAAVAKPKLPVVERTRPVVVHAAASVSSKEVAVSIAANAWADVMIDGQLVGRLPRVKPFALKPGKHRIRLMNPYLEPVQKDVWIPVGETFALRFDLPNKNNKAETR